jgi:hypothetical protein
MVWEAMEYWIAICCVNLGAHNNICKVCMKLSEILYQSVSVT